VVAADLAFIDTGITNARTEAARRMAEDAARIAFGLRDLHNQPISDIRARAC